LTTSSVCCASDFASTIGFFFSSEGAATTTSSSSRKGCAFTAGGQPSTPRRIAISNGSGALSGEARLVKSCGSMPG